MTNAILLLWITASAIAFFVLQVARPRLRPRGAIAIIVVAGSVAYLVPLLVFRNPTGLFSIDIYNYRLVASAVLDRRDVYEINKGLLSPHPYLPLQMYAFAAALRIADATPFTFFTLVRLPQAIAHLGTAVVIYQAVRRRGDGERAFTFALSYALCPLPLVISAYHGQFDAVSVFLAVAAWYVFAFHEQTPRAMACCGVLVGLGILDKSWPALLLPVLLYHGRGLTPRAALLGGAVLVPAAGVLAYLAAFGGSFHLLRVAATGYSGPENKEGQTYVLSRIASRIGDASRLLNWDNNHGTIILAAVLVVTALIVIPRRSPLPAIVALLVAFLASTTVAGIYHLLWILPFALLAGQRLPALALVAVATAGYLVVAFENCGIRCAQGGVLSDFIANHAHWLGVAEWGLLAGWLVWLLFDALGREFVPPATLRPPGKSAAASA